jgi:hypothetical protein
MMEGRLVDKKVRSCLKLKRNKQIGIIVLVLNQRYNLLLKTYVTF